MTFSSAPQISLVAQEAINSLAADNRLLLTAVELYYTVLTKLQMITRLQGWRHQIAVLADRPAAPVCTLRGCGRRLKVEARPNAQLPRVN